MATNFFTKKEKVLYKFWRTCVKFILDFCFGTLPPPGASGITTLADAICYVESVPWLALRLLLRTSGFPDLLVYGTW